ncbi:class I SAM-dependent methyltransferase [Gulosibacter sp. 10]|uniref:class I SAM-dependent methyltransferase n=1 Tax=Gulosibacter sp. 10 TaxID=1255570 RepID=UPI00097F038A|nr:class I SAM-dependent methyltransferase [Gulosibacter sp. 10]SJM71585.1 POSSIBLE METHYLTRANSFERASE (METHYLASE) [Gulosibacter sp. 10]
MAAQEPEPVEPADAQEARLPLAERRAEDAPGHWLLARLGKRVLRPGGLGLTRRLIARAGIAGADVVELAPGLGRTAVELIALEPRDYVGVEQDEDAAGWTRRAVGSAGRVVRADAAESGLPDASADVVVGEAMLTMQSDAAKRRIVAEAARLLRPGGRYAVHELGLHPDSLDPETKTDLRKQLARTIKVNARPLTVAEWTELLEDAGLRVEWTGLAPMALLQMRRNLADEGLRGTVRIIRNALRDADARRRVLAMRALFREHRDELRGVALVAVKPEQGSTPSRPNREEMP